MVRENDSNTCSTNGVLRGDQMLIERRKMFELLEELTDSKRISVETKAIIMEELINRNAELQPPKELIRLLQQS